MTGATPLELLLPRSAWERIGRVVCDAAPDLAIVTSTPDGAFERDGIGLLASQVDPDIVWLAPDAATDGSLPVLFDRIACGTRTRWVQSFLAGHDRPAFRDIVGRGVRLSKSTASAASIAEYATAHAFGLIVPIKSQRDAQRQRLWLSTPFREIGDTRWTLVGFGAIGSEIGRRVKAYGGQVTAVRRHAGEAHDVDAVIALSGLHAVLPETDVVVLACALNEQTRHLANDDFFQVLKRGAIVINVGRGALMDTEALRRGLDRDQPAHAVLDAFEEEPLPAGHWLWDHPKVRVSAHTSAYGSGTIRRNDELFLHNLAHYIADGSVLNEVTPAELGL